MSTIGEIATFIGRPGDDVRDPGRISWSQPGQR
jgi:hypothetical protein